MLLESSGCMSGILYSAQSLTTENLLAPNVNSPKLIHPAVDPFIHEGLQNVTFLISSFIFYLLALILG